MDRIKKLRKDPDTHTWLLDNIAPLIVGVKNYRTQCKIELPAVWLTPSSEAFALLCLENYYGSVVDTTLNRDPTQKPKWTAEGIRAKRNQGWKKEAIDTFDDYCKQVREDRENPELISVDVRYLETKKSNMNREDGRKRRREETRNEREDGWTRAYEDAWSEDDEVTEKVITGRADGREQRNNPGTANDEQQESEEDNDDESAPGNVAYH